MMKYYFQKIKNIYHLMQALAANLYYGFPSRKIKVIGVTGTDGKTTTTHLIYHILKSVGKKVSMISSVYAQIGDKIYDTGFHVTTPDVFPLNRLLKQSYQSGDEYFILETTSHSLYQNRVYGINYEAGVITNVTHEHLDMHRTLEEYIKIKLSLLERSRLAVANADDQSYKYFNRNIKHRYSYGILNDQVDFPIKMIGKSFSNIAEFNRYNYLAAFSVCRLLGIPTESILQSLLNFKLPKGRYEVFMSKPFTVIIDFAHTPNGIESIMKDVRKKYPKSRIIHVFGSASQRDTSKRPYMGEASGSYADLAILTEEDHRQENPVKIAREIAVGLKKRGFQFVEEEMFGQTSKSYTIITDRWLAVRKAIMIARNHDVVVLTGKGHEKSLCRGKKEVPWDEHDAVKKGIAEKFYQ